MQLNFTKQSTARNLTRYGLAGAAFIAAAAPADAGIVYSRLDTAIFSNGSLSIDLDGGGVNDFTLEATAFDDPFPATQVTINVLGLNGVAGVSQGTLINQDLSYAPDYTVIKSWFDEGQRSASVIAGLRFDIDGATHYGWMRVRGTANAGDITSSAFLYDVAYEDVAGAALLAPEAVPEPSSLALFALGAAGVAVLKRRRSA